MAVFAPERKRGTETAGPKPPNPTEPAPAPSPESLQVETRPAARRAKPTPLADPRLDDGNGIGPRVRLLERMQRTFGNGLVASFLGQASVGAPKRRTARAATAAATGRAAATATGRAAPAAAAEAPAAPTLAPAAPRTATAASATTAAAAKPAAAGAPGAAKGAPAKLGAGAAGPTGAAAAPGGAKEAGAAPKGPGTDPRFKAVIRTIGATKKRTRTLTPKAPDKVDQAHAAAKPPANDVPSKAATAQIGVMGAVSDDPKPRGFDRAGFIAAVDKAISSKNVLPQTVGEADDYKESGKAAQARQQVVGLVGKNKDTVAKGVEGATTAKPPVGAFKPDPHIDPVPETPGARPAAINAGAGMPQPVSAATVNLDEGPRQVAGELADADITEDQLRESNEPTFNEAVDAKHVAEEHAQTAPKQFRKEETDVLKDAKKGSNAEAAQGVGAMFSKRSAATRGIGGQKTTLQSRDEQKKAEVATKIEGIYNSAKSDVMGILEPLDGRVDSVFTTGEAEARRAFEDYVSETFRKYKKHRYRGWRKIKKAKDWIAGLPDEVKQFYVDGRKIYVDRMRGVINGIADIVEGELNRAKVRIRAARDEVKTFVESLKGDIRAFGDEALEKVNDQFADLEDEVDARGDELAQAVGEKYVAALKEVDERIEEMKQADKGLVQKAYEFAKGVVKTVLALKDLLFSVLSRALEAIGTIIRAPIKFLTNFVGAVKEGVTGFMDRIEVHLKNALKEWLFGSLADAGIELPDSLDFKGILSLVLQLAGISWQNIRERLVRALGEEKVQKVEQKVEVVRTLASEGIGGIWRFLEDKIGDIKDKVLSSIEDFVIQKVVRGGIMWLIGLLNPASAFIKACKAIYDIVMFLVDRAKQIQVFVDSIFDSITAIAQGGGAAAARHIENTLAKALGLAISFLASLLGLGNIGEHVRKIISIVRRPVTTAVDWLVRGAIKAGRKMFSRARAFGSRVREFGKAKYEAGKAFVTKKVKAGKAYVTDKAAAAKKYLKVKAATAKVWATDKGRALAEKARGLFGSKSFRMAGRSHQLIADAGPPPRLLMASTPSVLRTQLEQRLQVLQKRPYTVDPALSGDDQKKLRHQESQRFPAEIQALFQIHEFAKSVEQFEFDIVLRLDSGEDVQARKTQLNQWMAELSAMIEQFSDRFNRKDFTSTDERVTKEVPGLYAGVTTDKTHANWEFADDFQITPGPTITTWAIDPKGNRGKVIRTFNAAAGKLDLEQAFLEKVDRWIPAGTGLSAKGVPTIDYVTIRQMKLWEGEIRKDSTLSGAYPGGLHGNVREVSIHSIVNKRSRIELWGNMRNGDNAVTAAMKTNTFAYSVRSLIQSGHEIIPGTVTVSPADPFLYCTRIGRSRETWLADAEKKLMDETFARFNPTMDTQMPDGFAIALKLRKRR